MAMYSHDFSNKISDFWLSVEQCFFDSTESSHFLTRRCECGGGDRGGYSTATLPSHSFLSPFRKKSFCSLAPAGRYVWFLTFIFEQTYLCLKEKWLYSLYWRRQPPNKKFQRLDPFFSFFFCLFFPSPNSRFLFLWMSSEVNCPPQCFISVSFDW